MTHRLIEDGGNLSGRSAALPETRYPVPERGASLICGENLCPDIQTNISFVTVFIYIRSMDLLSTTEAAKLKNTSPQVVLRAVKRGETRWAKEKSK